jgi:hypothetical protein
MLSDRWYIFDVSCLDNDARWLQVGALARGLRPNPLNRSMHEQRWVAELSWQCNSCLHLHAILPLRSICTTSCSLVGAPTVNVRASELTLEDILEAIVSHSAEF